MLRLSQIVGRVHNIFGKKIFGRLRLTQNKQTWRRQQQKNKCDKNRPIILSYGIRLSCHGIFFYFITNGNVCVCVWRRHIFVAKENSWPLYLSYPYTIFVSNFPKWHRPFFFLSKWASTKKLVVLIFDSFPPLKIWNKNNKIKIKTHVRFFQVQFEFLVGIGPRRWSRRGRWIAHGRHLLFFFVNFIR
jgi:hypothetical protein